jgi:transposase
VVPDGRQVEVEEHEQIVERVAAIDVAKASGMVCTRVPHQTTPGKRITRVWEVAATTNAIIALADQLTGQGIERVVVESTSDYWRGFVYLLEARGLCVWLVNARDVKQVPGRPKTDKLDAVWLAKLNERGMLRPSFIPPAEIRQLRDYTRLRSDLTQERSRHVQRLEKLLEDALIKLSTVATDIVGVSGRAMLEALIVGQRDPKVLAELAKGRMRGKRAALVQALTGRFDDHHAELARVLLDHIDALTAQTDRLTARIEELIAAVPAAQPPQDQSGLSHGRGSGAATDQSAHAQAAPVLLPTPDRLDEVPGIGIKAAQVIIAEIGLDMGQFPTPAHLVSWAKLSPRTIQSGATHRAGTTGKGNPTSRACSAKPPPRPPRPTPSSASATGAWSNAAASSKPWSPSPAPSWSSSGTCSPIPPHGSTTWARTSPPIAPTPIARPATTSASCRRSGSPSP